ncbi:helix-turn-helix domain-containing protein [Paenibacillus sp. FSL R5-0519]|uniref:winged helix-turn-helix transcriptional regulator n=1 Tax=Paenibacillus sp. FSL R5-0519 TaxID=2921648 RepID=UPI0030DB0F1D
MNTDIKNTDSRCPVEATVSLIEGKWKILILYQLSTHEVRRFNELIKIFPDITHRTLTRQLRELEQDALVHRKVYPVVPPKVEYSLTDIGKSLVPILIQLQDWGTDYMLNPQEPNTD